MKFSPRRSPVAKAVRVLEFYVPSFGAAMLSGAPSADDACCSATPLHGSGLSSGAPVAAATSAGVMRAHFGARYTWPRRCCAGCCTAVADHLLLETKGCAAVGRGFVMSSDSTEAWDTQEWAVIELQHHPCRPFGPYPLWGPLLKKNRRTPPSRWRPTARFLPRRHRPGLLMRAPAWPWRVRDLRPPSNGCSRSGQLDRASVSPTC